MKTWNKNPSAFLMMAAIAMVLSACGTSRYQTANADATTATSISTVTATTTYTSTTTSTSTTTQAISTTELRNPQTNSK